MSATPPPSLPSSTLTTHLLSLSPTLFSSATNHPFLSASRTGTLPASAVSAWLTQDRFYVHAYVRFIGRMLSHTPSDYIKANGLVRKLVGLLSDALVNVQREVEFFERVARQYGLAMDEGAEEGRAVREMKGVMGSVELLGGEGRDDPSPGEKGMLMVGLVLLYGTEICYLTAWRNALPDDGQVNYKNDADGGALRTEFIPNWTSAEFKAFVERIAVLTDEWWNVAFPSDEDKAEILPHVEIAWRRLLEVEAKFWPEVT